MIGHRTVIDSLPGAAGFAREAFLAHQRAARRRVECLAVLSFDILRAGELSLPRPAGLRHGNAVNDPGDRIVIAADLGGLAAAGTAIAIMRTTTRKSSKRMASTPTIRLIGCLGVKPDGLQP